MKFDFAALRFFEDPNISDRVYWYLCPFPVKEGELVLAPVGSHDRLQCARVERTRSAEPENAPYDLRVIKEIAAKAGAHKRDFNGYLCRDLGGMRYDRKRFTRYGVFLCAEGVPSKDALDALYDYGAEVVEAGECNSAALWRTLARANDPVLICGACAKEIAARLLLLAGVCAEDVKRVRLSAGEPQRDSATFLEETGLAREEIRLLQEKLR